MNIPGHLLLEPVKLAPGEEWEDSSPGWRFVRISAGAAYWLGCGPSRALNVGEVLVLPRAARGQVRASQLNEVLLHAFSFAPELLAGFLTLADRQFFDSLDAASPEVTFLPSTHPVAERFAQLVEPGQAETGLSRRAAALALIAQLFDERLARHRPRTVRSLSAEQRFRQLIQRMPELELINHPPQELAALCHCSPRHFGRLFHRHFGVSARDRQTELRLLKAQQLLSETDTKVVHVALESGYRNLSLFNTMFKRRFGMTPSELRRKAARPARKAARAGAVAVLLATWLAVAGALAAESPPATNAPPAFAVRGYELCGNTLLPASVTEPIFAKHTGDEATFETIRRALSELQMAYRDRGFVTVSVAVPQQKLTNGIVRLQVTEGLLADVTIVNNRYFSSNNIRRALPVVRTNTILNGLVLQQQLDRANANSDRQIYPVLGPGPAPGTSALELKVKDRLPLHGRFDLDNYNTPETPPLRMNFAMQYNNLWQREHQLGAQYSFTPQELKSGNYNVFSKPLIDNYSAFYRLPLASVNGSPGSAEYKLSDFGYDEATRRFRAPPSGDSGELLFYGSGSFSDTGPRLDAQTLTPVVVPPEGGLQIADSVTSRTLTHNDDIGGRLSWPLPAFQGVRSTLGLGIDYKYYAAQTTQNRTFQATLYVPESGSTGPPFVTFESPATTSSRGIFNSISYLPISLNWDASRQGKTGVTTFYINNVFNFGNVLGGAANYAAIANSALANGDYYILRGGVAHDFNIHKQWGVRGSFDGQFATQPLISNEQFGVGGQSGPPGYYEGDAYGDNGWRFMAEPHTPYFNVGLVDNKAPMLVRFTIPFGIAEVYHIGSLAPVKSSTLIGVGAAIAVTIGRNVDLRAQAGLPLHSTFYTESGSPRFTFSLGAQF